MKRMGDGRRMFLTIEKAFKAADVQKRHRGVWSGVVRTPDGYYVLLHDPETEINE